MKYDICVFGGCSLDRMFYQNPDGSYDGIPNIKVPGGKGANQAVAAARAGAKVVMISRIGKDEIGKEILDNLAYNMINTSAVEMVDGLQNDYSDIYIDIKDKDNNIKRVTGAIDNFTKDMVDKYKDVILSSKIIVCQLKAPKDVTVELINFCHKNNKPLILTPCRPNKLSVDDDENLKLIDKISLITTNKSECETIFGTNDIEKCVEKYPNKLIVTLGKDGLMYHNGQRLIKMPAIEVDNVVDTTGAGDTFNGNLACFLSKRLDLQHALRKAMYASAMKIQVKTAQNGMPYADELNNFIFKYRNKKFEYKNELNLVLSIIKDSYKKEMEIKKFQKEDNSYTTTMDLAIEDYLVSNIKRKFPNDNFLTEEKYNDKYLQDRTWIIDPIDGTNHFIKSTSCYATQLAFYDKGTTMFSVIYIPTSDELYYAINNGGAYLNNNKLLPKRNVSAKEAIVEICGSINNFMDEKFMYLKKLIDKKSGQPLVLDFIYINSSSIAFTNLISGKTDAIITSVKKPWDIIPGSLFMQEVGIKSYNLDFNNHLKLYTKNEEVKALLLNN